MNGGKFGQIEGVEMTEHPILFNGPMVLAILEGRKTQTRRVIKPQPELSDNAGFIQHDKKGIKWAHGKGIDYAGTVRNFAHKCPYGQPGDRLWVRETFCFLINNGTGERKTFYRSDGILNNPPQGWKPSIFMPRWASRITLEITSIRVERLQDISGPDCWAEGITRDCEKYGSVTHTYQDLWESINGPGSWDDNPWVWGIEFKRVEV